jgi:hypothetical protein
MLNKGVRDEKKVKIDNMLPFTLVFVPKFWILKTRANRWSVDEILLSSAILQETSEKI